MNTPLPNGYQITEATPEMAEKLYDLMLRAMETTKTHYTLEELAPLQEALIESKTKFLKYFRRNGASDEPTDHRIKVVTDTNNDIVTVTDLVIDRESQQGFIYNTYKAPECDEKGIASALVEHMIELADFLGMKEVKLDATLNAVSFYRKLGFDIGDKTTLVNNLTGAFGKEDIPPFYEVRMVKHLGTTKANEFISRQPFAC